MTNLYRKTRGFSTEEEREEKGYIVAVGGRYLFQSGESGVRHAMVACPKCKAENNLFFTDERPEAIICGKCHNAVSLYRCFHCGVEHKDGDQAFIVLESIPYGSIHDSAFCGTQYACSSKCIVEAFSKDDFDAKGMCRRG